MKQSTNSDAFLVSAYMNGNESA
ncbi:MAG TPA: RNA polymerase subunit sigma-24, partial [Aequorivita sp.]|nr:RNA polymerase subunit sigma-24 [Aequorivita sp.]